jgi:hypothetical protein
VITLSQLEQEVARRTGPFFQAAQDNSTPTTSTTAAAYMPTLKTSALLGGPENLWLLRRGVLAGGAPTPQPVIATDRVRMVQTFDSGAGRVVVDRNWSNPMQPGELADFCHLHPEQELRVATLAGLRRCFFSDRGRVTPNVNGSITDLTVTLPWLTSPQQVLRLQNGYDVRGGGDKPFSSYSQAGHVLVTGASNADYVTVLRPVATWVNDTDTPGGPTADGDTLAVDLDYAASAGHIEAWHLFPAHLFAAAAGNLQASQQMAAAEFTRQSLIWAPHAPAEIAFHQVVRLPIVGY